MAMKNRNNLNVLKNSNDDKFEYELINKKGKCIARGRATSKYITNQFVINYNPVINFLNKLTDGTQQSTAHER